MAVSVSMDFDDPAADLAQIVITTKDASGTSLGTTTATLTNPAGQRKGTLHGLVNCGTAVAGTFELGFHVVDSAGHASNVLTAHFAVTPGGSSKTVRSMNDLKPVSSICLIRIRVPSSVAHATTTLGAGAPERYSATSSVFQYAASTALRKGIHSLYRRRL
jgi:hypothetical protein